MVDTYLMILEAAVDAYENSAKSWGNRAFYEGQLTTLLAVIIMDNTIPQNQKEVLKELIHIAEHNY